MRTATGAGPPAAASAVATSAALLTLAVAVVVIVFGVIATPGVYGSRVAWLLGVALPLLAASTFLGWWAQRSWTGRRGDGRGERRRGIPRGVFLLSLSLLGIPVAFAATALAVDACFIALHGVSLLL
jgi:hypothetical protein